MPKRLRGESIADGPRYPPMSSATLMIAIGPDLERGTRQTSSAAGPLVELTIGDGVHVRRAAGRQHLGRRGRQVRAPARLGALMLELRLLHGEELLAEGRDLVLVPQEGVVGLVEP